MIEIKITIPDYEYEKWDDFEKGGVDECEKTIEADIKSLLKGGLYIEYFEIETETV